MGGKAARPCGGAWCWRRTEAREPPDSNGTVLIFTYPVASCRVCDPKGKTSISQFLYFLFLALYLLNKAFKQCLTNVLTVWSSPRSSEG